MANRTIDANDIVGTTIGVLEVLQYVGRQEVGRKWRRYSHIYLVRCTKCGTVREMQRTTLQNPNMVHRPSCMKCDKQEAVLKSATKRRADNTPNANNHTTGIKHYSITLCSSKRVYRHTVMVRIDNKIYQVARYISNSLDCIPCMVEIADEMNEVLAAGGKEAFFEWYKANKANFPK